MRKLLCIASLFIIKQVNAQCPIAITANPTSICIGQSSTIVASGVTTYTWAPATGLSTTTGANVTATPSSTTTYTVHGNVGACLDSQTVTIYVTPNPTVTVSSSSGNICAGGTTTLTAYGAMTYSWSPTGGNSATNVISPTSTTNYTLCGASSGGCVSCTTVSINVNPVPSATMTAVNTKCNGACNGTATVSASGGTSPYTFSWTPTGGAVTTTSPNSIYSNLCTGNYTCTVNDINGCATFATVFISQPSTLTVTTANTPPSCGQCNGTATVSVSGGTPPYNYFWAPMGITPQVVSNLCPGTYTCIVHDINNCADSALAALINSSTPPTVSFTLTPSGTPHVWNVTPTFSGGTAAYTYSWNWGDGSTNSTIAYPSHTYTTAGWYNICVTLTDANGCTATSCQNDSVYRASSSSSMVTVNVINGSTGVNQLSVNSDQLSVYPNPANNNITIQSSTELGIISIYNALGEKVKETKTQEARVEIDISNLPSGVYTTLARGKYLKLIKE
ncbi:MAG TPA: T9SS type A sorting domain-containing protein [Bacteroidia bacterium]|jgi:PKD repeat protein|nr:T9SS type A sorting domain-containing protein [Bacteroidia bacterium]